MKVYEKINELKGTNAKKETILKWMVSNKICPLDVLAGIEHYDPFFLSFARIHCDELDDCPSNCYETFLDKEYKVKLDKPVKPAESETNLEVINLAFHEQETAENTALSVTLMQAIDDAGGEYGEQHIGNYIAYYHQIKAWLNEPKDGGEVQV